MLSKTHTSKVIVLGKYVLLETHFLRISSFLSNLSRNRPYGNANQIKWGKGVSELLKSEACLILSRFSSKWASNKQSEFVFYRVFRLFWLFWHAHNKAMRKSENSVIPCSAEIDLTGILTNGILTEINWISETRKFHGNLTEILTEMLNRNA